VPLLGSTAGETVRCASQAKENSLARLKRAVTLKHQGNLGEPVEEVAFEAGEEVTVLNEFADRYLIKKVTGQMFTAPKDVLEP